MRVAANQIIATTPNAPAAGYSLFRYSTGHGGLYCSACHGSTHAEFPSIDANDNVTSIQHQGHIGPMAECDACHNTQPSTANGGPHGMHPLGQTWVSRHQDNHGSQCMVCHGTDYRGTVLSQSRGDRTLSALGTKTFWRGFQIGCYTCHNGPGGDGTGPAPAVVTSGATSTAAGMPVAIPLKATGASGVTLTLSAAQARGQSRHPCLSVPSVIDSSKPKRYPIAGISVPEIPRPVRKNRVCAAGEAEPQFRARG